jgi:uncharacterized protein involved in exopolysaccharide biosynthesis
MELIALFRVLRRYRVVVALGLVVACAVGYMFIKGPTSRFGVASTRVVLDTPRSQTVDVNPVGIQTLEWRAALSVDLMTTDEATQSIARKMGIPADKLAVTDPSLSVPIVALPLPRAALEAAAAIPQPYHLSIQAATELPIIAVDSQAPTRREAARLAIVAVEALQAASSAQSDPERFVVEEAGPVQSHDVVSGRARRMALIVAALVFGVWCMCIIVAAALLRTRRFRPARTANIG